MARGPGKNPGGGKGAEEPVSWSQKLRTYIQTQLERRKPSFGSRLAEIQETLAQCGEDERLVLAYFYATMPIVDAGDYPPPIFWKQPGTG